VRRLLPGVGRTLLGLTLALAVTSVASAAPGVSFSATQVSYGNQLVGIRSAAQTLSITNSGDSPLTINSISFAGTNPGDFVINSDTGQATLLPGASRTLAIQCRPLAVGSRTAVLAVSDNAAGSPQLVSLTGNGVTTFVNRSPSAVNLGNVPVNVPAEQTVSIRNDGNTPLRITGFWINYNLQGGFTGVNFYWRSAASLPVTLSPGASTSVVVGCKPDGTGSSKATLLVYDDAPYSPHLVPLTATAVSPIVTLEPNILNFYKKLYGGPVATGGIGLCNSSGVPLTISSVKISGLNPGDFRISYDTGQQPLLNGDKRSFGIEFRPRALGNREAVLTVTHSAPGSPQQVVLKGEGVSTLVPRFPSTMNFGTRAVGTVREQIVSIRNDNIAATLFVDPTRTAIVGTNAGDFYWKPTDSFNIWMARGGLPYGYGMDIIVGFRPRSAGSKTATLAIFDNAPYSPHNVPLMGIGN
jgi:hypothetical protein